MTTQSVEQLVTRLKSLRDAAGQQDAADVDREARTLAFLLVDALEAAGPVAVKPPGVPIPAATADLSSSPWLPTVGMLALVFVVAVGLTFFGAGLDSSRQSAPRWETGLAPEKWTLQPSDMNGYTALKHQTPAERAAAGRTGPGDLTSTQAATIPAPTHSWSDTLAVLQAMPGVQRVTQDAGGSGVYIHLQPGVWEQWDGSKRQQAADSFQQTVDGKSTSRTTIYIKDFAGRIVAQSSTSGSRMIVR